MNKNRQGNQGAGMPKSWNLNSAKLEALFHGPSGAGQPCY